MKLATFSSKLASNEPLYVEIQDIKREESIEPNESSVENSKPFSFIQSSELKPENEDFRSKNHFNDLQARKQGPLKASYNDNGTGEEALLEEEEKVNFKSFQILKIIGSGAFGKIFLVFIYFFGTLSRFLR